MANTNLPLGLRGIWVPGAAFIAGSGTYTATRLAAGNYVLRKTAGAATTTVTLNLARAIQRAVAALANVSINTPQGTEVQAGGLFTGFDLVYGIGTAALTSLTPLLYQTSYVNNVAASINAAPGGTITPTPSPVPVATQANPYAVPFALATPYKIGGDAVNVADFLELSVVDPGTSVFDLYGVTLKFDANR